MTDIRAVTYEDMVGLTPSDTTKYANAYAGFLCTGSGVMHFLTALGRDAQFTVAADTIYPIAISQVFATSTTATGIYGLVAMPYKGAGA